MLFVARNFYQITAMLHQSSEEQQRRNAIFSSLEFFKKHYRETYCDCDFLNYVEITLCV